MCGLHDPRRAPRPQSSPIELDHIGIGVRSAQPELETVVTRFGATVLYGGYTPGCLYVVSRVGDENEGMDVELLEPEDAEKEPFLERFLQRHGPGAHHITFITTDLRGLLPKLAAAGLEPVVRRDFDQWREAFFSPKEAGGIVVQLAELVDGLGSEEAFELARADEHLGPETTKRRGWDPGTEGWWEWPGDREPDTAYLTRIVLASDDLDRGLELFEGMLGGEAVERGDDAVELRWPRGGRLRLERRDDRPPGFLRLDVARAPAGVESIGNAAVRPLAATA
jgi:catechol 2,3-dioxygenase-like lactoylglutathione lyase family enzyme